MLTTSPSLLERLRSRQEQQSWQFFVELYTPLLFRWARQLGLNENDAADLLQDIFTVLVEKVPTFCYDPQQSFRAWLKTILVNRWRNRCRQRSQRQRTEGGVDLEEVAAPEEVPFFEEEEYRQALVRRALALVQSEFQPVTWQACWEYVIREQPAQAVAERLGITVNAVYLAKSRVIRRLREQLNGLLD